MLKLYASACASHCTASHFDLMQVFLSLSSLSLLPSSSSSSSFVCMCSKASRIDCLEIPNQQRDHIYISHCIDCGVDSLPLFHILTKAVGFLFCYWALLSMRIIIDRTIQFHFFCIHRSSTECIRVKCYFSNSKNIQNANNTHTNNMLQNAQNTIHLFISSSCSKNNSNRIRLK